MTSVSKTLPYLQDRIKQSAVPYGTDPANVTITAVSKMQPGNKIRDALEAGHRVFGENRVQEAKEKWPALKAEYPDTELRLIGPLQINKVKDAVALFDVIETVDRPSLIDALASEMDRQNRSLPCLIQVNTGEEPQKAGVIPSELPELLNYAGSKGLNITGLMAIPPINEAPAAHFALLKKLAERHNLAQLSMGMSQDFEKAIPLGATHIRIGTALFGPRNPDQ